MQPWEDTRWQYPETLASPQQILIDASNGASDYGNKFGEPLIAGAVHGVLECNFSPTLLPAEPCKKI